MERLPFQYQKRPFWEFLCPICKRERRSFYWPSPRRRHYFALVVLAAFITFCFWTDLGVKGSFLVFPIWSVFELFYRARARQSLICPHCAFDPYLYKYDAKIARQRVESHFADRRKKLEVRSLEREKIASRLGGRGGPEARNAASPPNDAV